MKMVSRKMQRTWLIPGFLALACLRCDLPHGDEQLPNTDAVGGSRQVVLRLLAPPEVRRVGAVVPITVEVAVASGVKVAAAYCVALAGEPGRLRFPFGDGCANVKAEASDAGVDGGPHDDVEPSTISDDGRDFSRAHACLRLNSLPLGGHSATAIAAYLPHGEEATTTLFGSLYDNATCAGVPVVTTAELLVLRGTNANDRDGGQGGAAPDGGGGTGGKPEDGGVDASDASTEDAARPPPDAGDGGGT
jgi:hypothetical protein